MKFCIQRSLAQPGKHAKFQQGCRGRKAKGGKAINARGQNFQKLFFQLFLCFCVCISPIFRDIMPNIADAMQIANCGFPRQRINLNNPQGERRSRQY